MVFQTDASRPRKRQARQLVSTSAMFKKATTLKSNKQFETKRTRFVDAPSSSKKPIRLRKVPQHPLAIEFNDATSTYSDALLDSAKEELSKTHEALLTRLDDGSKVTKSDKQPGSTIKDPTIVVDDLRRRVGAPLAEETIIIRQSSQATSETVSQTIKLGDRMKSFKAFIDGEEKQIHQLKTDYDKVNAEIGQFIHEVLGPRAASNLLAPSSIMENTEYARMLDAKVQGISMKTAKIGIEQKDNYQYPQLQAKLDARIKEMEKEIAKLGALEFAELEKEKKSEGTKRKKLIQFLQDMEDDSFDDK